jgi:hypothetical protein
MGLDLCRDIFQTACPQFAGGNLSFVITIGYIYGAVFALILDDYCIHSILGSGKLT